MNMNGQYLSQAAARRLSTCWQQPITFYYFHFDFRPDCNFSPVHSIPQPLPPPAYDIHHWWRRHPLPTQIYTFCKPTTSHGHFYRWRRGFMGLAGGCLRIYSKRVVGGDPQKVLTWHKETVLRSTGQIGDNNNTNSTTTLNVIFSHLLRTQ